MKLKVTAAVLMCAILLTLTASCGLFDKTKDALSGAAAENESAALIDSTKDIDLETTAPEPEIEIEPAKSAAGDSEEFYYTLNDAVSNPDNIDAYFLPETFEFSAFITYGKETIPLEEGSGDFVSAIIARNYDKEILIEVTEYDGELPEAYEFVKVTARLEGCLYTTEGGERISYLWLSALGFMPLEESDVPVNETDTDSVVSLTASGDVTFKSAEFSTDVFGDIVILYFEFTNTSDRDIFPIMNSFEFYANNENSDKLEKTIFEPAQVDGSALATTKEKTFIGKTQLYYMTFRAIEGADSIVITRYDDDFNCVYAYTMAVNE